jgi:catechol 2,3-dioxygenase-like lactoylglutathione lyase family enzyme
LAVVGLGPSSQSPGFPASRRRRRSPLASAQEGLNFRAATIDHVSIQVANLKRSSEFYQMIFGFREVSGEPARNILRLGNTRTLVSLNLEKPTATVNHFAIGIPRYGKDAATRYFTERGVKPLEGNFAGFHVLDPDARVGSLVQEIAQILEIEDHVLQLGQRDTGNPLNERIDVRDDLGRAFRFAAHLGLMLRPVFPVRNPGRWRRLSRQQRHQPSLDHVLQELVAELRNGLIGAYARHYLLNIPITPHSWPTVLEPENTGRGVGRDMLTVLDLRYDAVLVAENLNGIVLIAVGAGV